MHMCANQTHYKIPTVVSNNWGLGQKKFSFFANCVMPPMMITKLPNEHFANLCFGHQFIAQKKFSETSNWLYHYDFVVTDLSVKI